MINSNFYICSENKLLNSDAISNYSKLCDGWKVNWTPDLGFLGHLFNKQTDYVITFNTNETFDLIKIYFLPSTDYFWGTRQTQERPQDDGLQVKLYYTIDGTNWVEINNTNAVCINNWFNLNNKNYDIIRQAWNLGTTAEILFLKLNSKITGVKKIKFVLNWSNPNISNWGITEFEIKETKNFQIKDINIDDEKSILENSFNTTKIILNTYDTNFGIYNFIIPNSEVFGYIIKNSVYYYFSNFIVDEANIVIEQRILSLVLKHYFDNYLNNNVNYNTPILFKKSYYTLSNVLELLLLQGNIPQYFVNFYSGYSTNSVYYPNIDMTIKDEINDFLKSNLNAILKKNYQGYFTIDNKGYENYQIISKSQDNYLEFANNYTEEQNLVNPIMFNKNLFSFDTFLSRFFTQELYFDTSSIKVFDKEITTKTKRKTKKFLFFKTTDRRIEYETQLIEKELQRDKFRFDVLLLDFPMGKEKEVNNYYVVFTAQSITAKCITIPMPNNAMYCQADFYLSDKYYNPNIITKPDRITFKYKDIRGEQTLEYQIPNFIPLTKLETILNYFGDTSKHYIFRVKMILSYNGTATLDIGFISRSKSTGSEFALWRYILSPGSTEGTFLRSFMTSSLSGYTQGICEITIKSNLSYQKTNYLTTGFKIQGVYLSGISRKYQTDIFTLTDCKDVNIREWSEREFYNLLPNKTNIKGEVYYKLNEIFYLDEKLYNLTNLKYPANGNLEFIYVLKNVYPYSSYGKLWFIKSITQTNFLTYNYTYYAIEKYSKQLSYTKTIKNIDKENIITRLILNKNKQITNKKTTTIEFDLEGYSYIEKEISLNDEYLIIGSEVFDIIIDGKIYSVFKGTGNIASTNVNLNYIFSVDLYKIYIKITNNLSTRLTGKLEINYLTFSFELEKNIIDFEDLKLKYGIIEYDLVSGQLFLSTQEYFIYEFFNSFYNTKAIFNNNDIIIDNDLGIKFDTLPIKIIDNYLSKYFVILPYYINHYINEDLYSETSIKGKIIEEGSL